MTASVRLAACVLSGCLAVGCGAESSSNGSGGSHAGGTSSGGSGGTSGAGGSGLGGAGGAGGTILQPGLDLTVMDETSQPIAGAIVVVDRPDGSRDETKTDALGVASFPDVDFTLGLVDVTAFSPGRVLVTVLDVGATSSHVIHLSPPSMPFSALTQKIKLSFLNKVSGTDCVKLSATLYSSFGATCDDSLEVSILPGASGKLLAMEFAPPATTPEPGIGPPPPILSAVAVDIPGSGSSVDVDFAKSAKIEHAAGSIQAPTDGAGFMQGSLAVDVRSATSPYFVTAALSASSPAGGGVIDGKADFFRAFPDSEARTSFWLSNGSPAGGGVVVSGYPGEGGPLPTIPLPPTVESKGVNQSLFDPIAWVTSADRPDHLSVYALGVDAGLPSWNVWFPPERDQVSLRKPPDSIWNALDWKDAGQGVFFLYYCDPGPEQCNGHPCAPTEEPRCVRNSTAVANFFSVDPP